MVIQKWLAALILTAVSSAVALAQTPRVYPFPICTEVDVTGAVYVVACPTSAPTATPVPTPSPPTPTPTMAPSPTPTAVPTSVMYYVNKVPGTAYPIAVKLPRIAHGTVVASVNGTALALGGTLMSFSNSWTLEAGNFTVGINPPGSAGLHIWDALSGLQASAALPLIAGKTVTLAATEDGVNLSLYVCSPACVKASVPDPGTLGIGTTAYIGGSGNGIRICSTCHIWSVAISGPLQDSTIQAWALAAPPDPYPSATPAPSPTATANPTPTAVPTTGSSNPYYPYSAKFTGKTPFHYTIAQMQNANVIAQDSNQGTEANNFWAGGVAGNQTPYGQTPDWVGASGQSLYTWSGETMYGPPNANILGMQSHLPPGATGQNASYDAHTVGADPTAPGGGGEFGGWECGTSSSSLTHCQWGAFYAYSGSGLSYDLPGMAGELNAGGYAPGLLTLTAYDMWNAAHGTPIAHGLGMVTGCGQSPAGGRQYPSSASSVEVQCSRQPNTTYGSIVQLNPSFNVSGSGASQYCQYILTALQQYGAYVDDGDGNYGITLNMENPYTYDQEPLAGQPNYWTQTVFPSLSRGGDGNLNGTPSLSNAGAFVWTTCLNRIPGGNGSNYWMIWHITTHTSGLP